MIKVRFVKHPIADPISRQLCLETILNNIDHNGGTILHITSDTEGYTVVYWEGSKTLHS